MNKLFYSPKEPSAFSTLSKLKQVVKPKDKSKVHKWLIKQDAYTLHKPVRKNFLRNPYTPNNIYDVFEVDLVDLQSLSKHNDGVKYLLNLIDVFSKQAYSEPLINKTGKSITTAFSKILKQLKQTPLVVRSDRGKEFLNTTFQDLLKKTKIEFQICRNPDVKCSVVERFNRTLKTKMYKYFTYKNSYRYIDVLQDFLTAYNNTVHSTTGKAPSKINETNVLEVWRRMNSHRQKQKPVRFSVGQTVRISKEKMKFAKGFEQSYSTEVFKICKVIRRVPQPLYEIEDLQGTPIEGQFYNEELTPVLVTKQTEFKIDKILKQRTRNGRREYWVKWKGYGPQFNSWILASSLKKL